MWRYLKWRQNDVTVNNYSKFQTKFSPKLCSFQKNEEQIRNQWRQIYWSEHIYREYNNSLEGGMVPLTFGDLIRVLCRHRMPSLVPDRVWFRRGGGGGLPTAPVARNAATHSAPPVPTPLSWFQNDKVQLVRFTLRRHWPFHIFLS